MGASEETGAGATRIDRWLFGVRLFKSRSAATDAVSGGKVHVNGERVKPSRAVKPGDTVTFTRSAVVFECVVAAVPLRRGPASAAAGCYEETPASKARREDFASRMHLAEVAHLSPRQFSRAFQAETGQTPAKAIEKLRLEGARALMEDTNHTIDVVAQETGFRDRNRVRRAFLRTYGQPPQVIRQLP